MRTGASDMAASVRALAICYMLPPALYPQAIQIGRLLAHSRLPIGVVTSPVGLAPGEAPAGAEPRLNRFIIDETGRQWPGLHRMAMRFLPRYGAIPDEYRDWAARAAPLVLGSGWLKQFNPNVIVSFGEPMSDHLLGLEFKRQLGLPWIAHFSDPWADHPFRRPLKLAKAANRALEAEVVRAADALIFTAEETMALFAELYGPEIAGKSRILVHSFDPTLYTPPPPRPGGPLVARYIGNFYGSRSPVPLLRAIDWLKANNPSVVEALRIEFVGSMPGWMKLLPEIRNADPRLCAFRPSVKYQQSLDLMVSADILLVLDAPARTSLFLPSKLIDYLGAARPILGAVPPGPSKRLIDEIGGWTADPDKPVEIARAIADCVSNPNRRRISRQAFEDVQARYTADHVAAQFDGIIAGVLAANAGSSPGGSAR